MVKAFDFDDPQARSGAYNQSKLASAFYTIALPPLHPAFRRYGTTKLANLLFTYELARRLEGTGVTVNALHPGFVATSFPAGNGVFGWFVRRWASLLAIPVEQGARTSIYLASSPEVEGVAGGYFVKQRRAESSAGSRDEAAARRLWALSEEWTGGAAKSA
jgi:NAD(P)-dependent dehydrogenase (short-subunit alcohol dehydrogenase family)